MEAENTFALSLSKGLLSPLPFAGEGWGEGKPTPSPLSVYSVTSVVSLPRNRRLKPPVLVDLKGKRE